MPPCILHKPALLVCDWEHAAAGCTLTSHESVHLLAYTALKQVSVVAYLSQTVTAVWSVRICRHFCSPRAAEML